MVPFPDWLHVVCIISFLANGIALIADILYQSQGASIVCFTIGSSLKITITGETDVFTNYVRTKSPISKDAIELFGNFVTY